MLTTDIITSFALGNSIKCYVLFPFQKITNKTQTWKFIASVFDHLPFFMASLIFKVGSILILAVYLPYGLIGAVLLIIVCNVTIGYRRYHIWGVSNYENEILYLKI